MRKILLVLILLGCGCASTETTQSQQGVVKEEVKSQTDQESDELRKQKFQDWQKKMREQQREQNQYK
ncbi:MAG: hypothetical protein H8D23_20160 [Candidatus Brocadiales bacterium]|nr:hypothetical protein [Candidatus Brocadiales bacterium]